MKQYLELLRNINENGDHKADAREGLPGTKSLFGPQMEFDLSHGFPIVTTKEVKFSNIVVELLWFLSGKSNIKPMVDQGVNIWNEDAYNYFCKLFPDSDATFEEFIRRVKAGYVRKDGNGYKYGDTGNQYPRTWRNFGASEDYDNGVTDKFSVDQISRVLTNLRKNPNGRRHLVSSIDVRGDQDLALYWCHALFQFNCRQLTTEQRIWWAAENSHKLTEEDEISYGEWLDNIGAPEYYLDCKLYQRSADTVLGVPYNISSYALLIEIFAKILNYIPGRFIHTFGDVHIYDNHQEAVDLQLTREPRPLPWLEFSDEFYNLVTQYTIGDVWYTHEIWSQLTPDMFYLESYNHHAPIKATLNTGMNKVEFKNGSTLEFKDTDSNKTGRGNSPVKDLMHTLGKIGADALLGDGTIYDNDGNPLNIEGNDGQ